MAILTSDPIDSSSHNQLESSIENNYPSMQPRASNARLNPVTGPVAVPQPTPISIIPNPISRPSSTTSRPLSSPANSGIPIATPVSAMPNSSASMTPLPTSAFNSFSSSYGPYRVTAFNHTDGSSNIPPVHQSALRNPNPYGAQPPQQLIPFIGSQIDYSSIAGHHTTSPIKTLTPTPMHLVNFNIPGANASPAPLPWNQSSSTHSPSLYPINFTSSELSTLQLPSLSMQPGALKHHNMSPSDSTFAQKQAQYSISQYNPYQQLQNHSSQILSNGFHNTSVINPVDMSSLVQVASTPSPYMFVSPQVTSSSMVYPSSSSSSSDVADASIHQCPHDGCQQILRSRFSLKRHMKKHTGDKPHLCPHKGCPRSFSETTALKRHSRIHTGEKPYRCSFEHCTKTFADATNVKRHEMTHSGEKPYHCMYGGCNRGFSRRSSLRTHMATLHNVRPEIADAVDKFDNAKNISNKTK